MPLRPDWPRPAAVLDNYLRTADALGWLADAFGGLTSRPRQFAMLAEPEAQALLGQMNAELKQQGVMLLTASLEATFQVDLQLRVARKLKDPVSRRLRRLHRAAERSDRRIEVEELLDAWKKETGNASALGQLRQVIGYRHWLAHGRYWEQKSGLTYLDPGDVWDRWERVRDLLPDFPIDFD